MTPRQLTLVSQHLDSSDLAAALRTRNVTLHRVEPELDSSASPDGAIAARHLEQYGGFDGLIVAPLCSALNEQDPSLESLLDLLTTNFAHLKAAIASFESRGSPGSLIALLPGNAAMGDPEQLLDSTLCGAMLSLFRTIALELRKTCITANTLMYTPAPGGLVQDPIGLATLIDTLLRPESRGLSGQEIYAMAGADVGRLHP